MLFDKTLELDMGDDTNRDMLALAFRIAMKRLDCEGIYSSSLDSLMRLYYKIYTTAYDALAEQDEIAFSKCIDIPSEKVGCIIDSVGHAMYSVLDESDVFGFDRDTIDVFGLFTAMLIKRKNVDGYILTHFNTEFHAVPVYSHKKFVKVSPEIMTRMDTFSARFCTGGNSDRVILDAALETMESIDEALCGKVFSHTVVAYLYYAVMEYVRKKSYETDSDFTTGDVIASIPDHIKLGIPDDAIETVFQNMHAAIHNCAAYAYRDFYTKYIRVMEVYEMLISHTPTSDELCNKCSGGGVIKVKYESIINHEYTHTGVWRCLNRPKPLYRVIGRVF